MDNASVDRNPSSYSAIFADKSTATDDPPLVFCGDLGAGDDQIACLLRYISQTTVSKEHQPTTRRKRRDGACLSQQQSFNTEVTAAQRRSRLKRHHTAESYWEAPPVVRKGRGMVSRQGTTESSDSGYSKRYSREMLPCAHESATKAEHQECSLSHRQKSNSRPVSASSRPSVSSRPTSASSQLPSVHSRPASNCSRPGSNPSRPNSIGLPFQETKEDSLSSLLLIRQSSINSGDNNSAVFLRQSTLDTNEDLSFNDFSRTSPVEGEPTVFTIFSHETKLPDQLPMQSMPVNQHIEVPEQRSRMKSTTSCSLINLSLIDIPVEEVKEIHQSLLQEIKTPEKNIDLEGQRIANRVRRRNKKGDDEMPKNVKYSIMATGLILLLMSVILVGATLRMAPLIDEMVRKDNEGILRNLAMAAEEAQANSTKQHFVPDEQGGTLDDYNDIDYL